MASDKDPTAREGESAIQVKLQQVPAKLVTSPAVSNRDVRLAVSAAPPASAPAVMVVTKLAKPVGTGVHGPKAATVGQVAAVKAATVGQVAAVKAATVGQVAAVKAASAPGRTLLITVPRSTGPPVTHLPANIQIPPGMVLIRSESGQLMLMSQQALAQAQQAGRLGTTPAPPASTAPRRSNEKVGTVTVAPPAFQPPANQKTATVKVIAVTPKAGVPPTRGPATEVRAPVAVETKKEPQPVYSQETLESVKKCKNFLVTLMKLASSDSKSAHMANNVRGLVRSLLEGELEAEGFTEALYRELKSTPQPCLVPFLKKSLPAVRRLTADPQVFIQQACGSSSSSSSSSSGPASNKSSLERAPRPRPLPQAGGVAIGGVSAPPPIVTSVTKGGTPVVQMGKKLTGGFTVNQAFPRERPPHSIPPVNRVSSGSYKEDDDINDIPSMAGVNLREENARGLIGAAVGSLVRSCQDRPFLSAGPALARILRTGRALGVTEVLPEAVALVSHATQERLRALLEKLSVAAQHRKAAPKEDFRHERVNDARSQLRFLEDVEAYKKKKRDEEERERLMRLARSRSHAEDPFQQQMKQRAKEMQQMEEAQSMHREANLTALAAIGPRKKKRAPDLPQGPPVVPGAGPRQTPRRPPTRVVLRDLLLCMENDRFLRHSLALYKAML
ncbi:transcription initiation factor TFIID subunit 4-like isoform X2 [Stigmatopora nigra]